MQCMGFGLHILFPNHLHDMIVFLKERVSRVPIPQLHLFFFFFGNYSFLHPEFVRLNIILLRLSVREMFKHKRN